MSKALDHDTLDRIKKDAVKLTREILTRSIENIDFLINMASLEYLPKDIERVVEEILVYLEKTKEEETEINE